jgi:hypothetical protein
VKTVVFPCVPELHCILCGSASYSSSGQNIDTAPILAAITGQNLKKCHTSKLASESFVPFIGIKLLNARKITTFLIQYLR